MTLTLDEVRKTRFHMARRAGYEVTDVDNFVDKVEATMMHLVEENQTLKQQLSTIAKAEPSSDLTDENARLRKELEEAKAQAAKPAVAPIPANADEALKAEVERLRAENDKMRGDADKLRADLDAAQRRQPAPAAAPAAPFAQQQPSGGTERLVVTTSQEASPAVVRLVQLATSQAEQVVAEADAEAKRKVDDANRQAHEIQVDARTKAERIESEARVNAEKVTTDARTAADNLNQETNNKRTELFTQLEAERDTLRGRVEELRGFESSFRKNITDHLKSQIDSLEKGVFEPQDKPGILGEAAKKAEISSATPRLDALLADNR